MESEKSKNKNPASVTRPKSINLPMKSMLFWYIKEKNYIGIVFSPTIICCLCIVL